MEQIVIIGGGLSSRLLLIHLLRATRAANGERRQFQLKVTTVEQHPLDRIGDAFCTDTDCHLLNVAAGKMSAYEDDPGHLAEWLSLAGYDYNSYSFIPRRLYKSYIVQTLEREMQQARGIHPVFLRGEATDISVEDRVVSVDGVGKLSADKVILALGNFRPGGLRLADNAYLSLPGYYGSAWEQDIFRDLKKDDPVLLLGAGLTMVDAVLSFYERGHRGRIVALSTHGYIPAGYKPPGVYPSFEQDLSEPDDIVGILRVIRRHVGKAETMNIDWRAVIDSIRPFTQRIWLKFSATERRRFLEHLRHIWGVVRHRMPAENASVVEQLLRTGQLEVVAGRVSSISAAAETGFRIEYNRRATLSKEVMYSKVIVNCMGPELNWNRIRQPLVMNLLEKGIIDTDELQLGVNCTPDGAIIGKDRGVSELLWTIGSPAKGILWETTAVPEIRRQAEQLTNMLLSPAVRYAER